MKDKIESKIAEIVNYIVEKPVSNISKEDYDILSSELRRIKYEADMEQKNKKFAELMSTTLSTGFGGNY